MSNRHTRRGDLATSNARRMRAFADVPDRRHRRCRAQPRATAVTRGVVLARQHPASTTSLPACKANYADDAAQPSAYLFATIAVAPTNAAVSVFCSECWRDLPLDMIERSAERVLQRLLPGGHFEPLNVQRRSRSIIR